MDSRNSATRRALWIDELFVRIMKECVSLGHRGTMLALAKTCRSTHKLAIRALWRELNSLEPLLYILPSDAVRVVRPNNYIELVREPTNEEMERILGYGSYVEELKLPHFHDNAGGIGQQAIDALLYRRRSDDKNERYLFPNLQRLEVNDALTLIASRGIVNSQLKAIDIKLPLPGSQAEFATGMTGFLGLFDALLGMCRIGLRSLTIDPAYVPRFFFLGCPVSLHLNYSKFVSTMAPKALLDFRSPFPVTTEAATVLLTTDLDACHVNLDHSDMGALNTTLLAIPKEETRWGRLVFLRLDFFTLTDEVLSLVRNLNVPRLEELHLTTCIRFGATQTKVSDFMHAIASLSCATSLKKLQIDLSRYNGRLWIPQTELQEDYIIDDGVISPLLQFNNLIDFRFASVDLIANNKIVEALAHAFRHLKVLHLSGHAFRGDIPMNEVTWRALSILNECCPNLTDLYLTINAYKDLKDYVEGQPNPNLAVWHVGTSVLPLEQEEAQFLQDVANAIWMQSAGLNRLCYSCSSRCTRFVDIVRSMSNPVEGMWSRSWQVVSDHIANQ